ncbi:16S rRNA pseudouridine(516) synthase [Akkermansiaceae bacterium]|nr:16S rRNA pseudouridine(516) synthase [Akkermansiaceae bacterium]
MRLDRLIGKWGGWGKRSVRERFESGVVSVNGEVIEQANTLVGKFDRVEVGDQIVQVHVRRSLLLNKPAGVVSATTDEEHQTVIDLIKEDWASELHLAGRLDRFTTGLMILTNDSQFSESLTKPGQKVGKRYLVETDAVITSEMIEAFRKGMWFAKEKVTTAPAIVELVNDRTCWLTIYEGKHHQVKRMFARFELKVIALHRESIGEYELGDLASGEWRMLCFDLAQSD